MWHTTSWDEPGARYSTHTMQGLKAASDHINISGVGWGIGVVEQERPVLQLHTSPAVFNGDDIALIIALFSGYHHQKPS